MFASHIYDKRLKPRIYRELKLSNNKITQLKIEQRTKIDISPEKIDEWPKMANDNMKKCSPSLIIREMQITITS